jgi:hypothetical protein
MSLVLAAETPQVTRFDKLIAEALLKSPAVTQQLIVNLPRFINLMPELSLVTLDLSFQIPY